MKKPKRRARRIAEQPKNTGMIKANNYGIESIEVLSPGIQRAVVAQVISFEMAQTVNGLASAMVESILGGML